MHRLRWWWFFWVQTAAIVGLSAFGYIEALLRADTTHLGPAILVLYAIFTGYVGRLTIQADLWNYAVVCESKLAALRRKLKACDLMVKSLVILGIIGTTSGLLLMLNAAFGGDMNPTTVLAGLKHGLSTLGITTLVGLACYLLLEVQVVNLEYALEAR